MLSLLSPAKKLNEDPIQKKIKHTTYPVFQEKTEPIINKLKKMSKPKLMELMNISPKLAQVNQARYQEFEVEVPAKEEKPAIFMFNGEVYFAMEVTDFNQAELDFAQNHVRILSGLYGLLRPLDNIQAYRLEMGTNISIGRKKNLYAYWQDAVTEALIEELDQHENPCIINLASKEYEQVVDFQRIPHPMIRIHFKEFRDDKLRSIQFNLKKARGLMTQWMIDHEVDEPEVLKSFDIEDYYFSAEHSDAQNWTFIR